MKTDNSRTINSKELENLKPYEKRQLDFLSRFYFEVITKNQKGLITKPTPRQFLKFVKANGKRKMDKYRND